MLINNPTNNLHRKKQDNMSFVFPVVFLHNCKDKFKNNSEKKRFTYSMELFLKLKYLIEKDVENKFDYIREVISNLIHYIFKQL